MKRKRKFADGGGIPGLSVPGVGDAMGTGKSYNPNQSTARGGLDMVGTGYKTVGSALDDIQSRLGSGGGQSPGIGVPPSPIGIPGIGSPGLKRGGKVKAKKYASGGSVFRRAADGVARRGKTKGTFV